MTPERLEFQALADKSLAMRPRAARPSTAPAQRPRAPPTMIDKKPGACVPGYTGHQPGVVSDSLLGRSYAFITGHRGALLHKDDARWQTDYKQGHCSAMHETEPEAGRIFSSGKASHPSAGTDRQVWGDKKVFYDVLNLNETGRMPGYTGHVPHFKFSGSLGLPFAKACNQGDHLRPPDGSHNAYRHEAPGYAGTGQNAKDPIAGYSGHVPFMQTESIGQRYSVALSTCQATGRQVSPNPETLD